MYAYQLTIWFYLQVEGVCGTTDNTFNIIIMIRNYNI